MPDDVYVVMPNQLGLDSFDQMCIRDRVCSAALAVAAEICPAAEILIAPVLQLVKATPCLLYTSRCV